MMLKPRSWTRAAAVWDVMAPKALLVVALATSAAALTVPILSLDHGPLPLDILSLDELLSLIHI